MKKLFGWRKNRPQRQFSKLHVIFANGLVAFAYFTSTLANYTLSVLDKQQIDFSLALALVTVYGGFATSGYFIQNCVRDTSKNKHKRCADCGTIKAFDDTEESDV